MTEKNYSANFKLYNRDGLNAQFTVRADDPTEHINALTEYMNSLKAMGWSVNEPERGLYTTDQAIGYLWTQFNNRKTNALDTCLAIYTERGLFKGYTVYPESFDKLPQDVMQTMPDDPAGALPMAPDKEKALTMKAFKPWRVTINITPRLGHDGEPVRNDKGYIVYLFDGVAGKEQAVAAQPEPNKPPVRLSAHAEAVNLDKAKVSPELLKARHTFHALGSTLYGEEWDTIRHKAVAKEGYQSSNDMPMDAIEKMILRLEKATRQECHNQAEINGWIGETLANICEEMQRGKYEIEEMSGVALTKLLKELRLPCKLPKEELEF